MWILKIRRKLSHSFEFLFKIEIRPLQLDRHHFQVWNQNSLLFGQFWSDFEDSRFNLTRIVSQSHTYFQNKILTSVAGTATIFCVKTMVTSLLSCFSITSETVRGWQFCGQSYAIPQFESSCLEWLKSRTFSKAWGLNHSFSVMDRLTILSQHVHAEYADVLH